MLDVVDRRGQEALIDCSDAPFGLFRAKPGLGPSYGDNRNVDAWKDVRRRPQNDYRRQDKNE